MVQYKTPIKDMYFTLRHMEGFEKLLDGENLNEDLLKAVFTEAGKFTDEVVAPLNQKCDTQAAELKEDQVYVNEDFKHAYQKMIENGWTQLAADAEYGGQALPISIVNTVFEMFDSCLSLTLCPILTAGAIEALQVHADDAYKKIYLPKLNSGEWTATMNLTEPSAGSDVGAVKTKAVKQNDGTYKITGTKIFITYGDHDMSENIIHLVLARLPNAPEGTKGISLFIVPKFLLNDSGEPDSLNDVKCVGLEDKLGLHASPTCVMSYGDDGGAIGYLVGKENAGMAAMFTMMNNARINVGLQGVSLAECATQAAFSYAKERKQGVVESISEYPDIRHMLLKMKSLTQAARCICYASSVYMDLYHRSSGSDVVSKSFADLLIPLAKSFSTDIANEVAGLSVQVHGGMGFIEETGVAQYVRDSRILTIYEGTNGIQALDLIGRKLSMQNGQVVQDYLMKITELISKTEQGCLKAVSHYLASALEDLQKATQYISSSSLPLNDKLSGATQYQRLFSLVVGCYYLFREVVTAEAVGETDILKNKKIISEFFATQILPETKGLLVSILSENDSLSDESFTTLYNFNA